MFETRSDIYFVRPYGTVCTSVKTVELTQRHLLIGSCIDLSTSKEIRMRGKRWVVEVTKENLYILMLPVLCLVSTTQWRKWPAPLADTSRHISLYNTTIDLYSIYIYLFTVMDETQCRGYACPPAGDSCRAKR